MRNWLWSFALVSTVAMTAHAAWVQQAEIRVKAHDHEFHAVRVESTDCNVRYKLSFSAPESAYPAGKSRYYQFHARIRFHSGKSITSLIFANPGAGERVYERVYDTTTEGCWARDTQKLLGVDVEACRGRGCVPATFDAAP